jgi:uncharacterized membrane protein
MKMQAIEPWKKVVLWLVGVMLSLFGLAMLSVTADWLGISMLLLGVGLIIVALLGQKRTV